MTAPLIQRIGALEEHRKYPNIGDGQEFAEYRWTGSSV